MKGKSKPWYFLFSLIPYIISPIIDQVVLEYFPEKAIKDFLDINISIKFLLPIFLGIIIFIICGIFYISGWKKKANQHLTPDEFDELDKKLKDLVDKNEYVESVQAYQYWYKNDSESKYIKVCYITGSVDERIDINSIMQTHYYIPYSLNKKLKYISELYDSYLKATDPNTKDSFRTLYKAEGKSFCETVLLSLNSLNTVDDIKKYHCELYQCALRVLSLISDKPIETILKNPDIENELIRRRKTGLLGSIIIHDTYIFKNQSSSTKTNRVYCSFPYDTDKNIVLLISLSNDTMSNEKDIVEYCKGIRNEIVDK